MGGSDKNWVCPECHGWNRAGSTACWLCARRLETAPPETTAAAPKLSVPPTSPGLDNPYAPPTTFDTPAHTFRISSVMLMLAVIVVSVGVGPFGVVPALVYTSSVAAERKARGRPMVGLERLSTFLAALIGVVVIAVSAFIAFCVTCVPIAIAADKINSNAGLIIAFAIGCAAAVAATFMTYFLVTWIGRRWGIPGKR
jgi:hypothetical protein